MAERNHLWSAMLAIDAYDSNLDDPRIRQAFDLICQVWVETMPNQVEFKDPGTKEWGPEHAVSLPNFWTLWDKAHE